MAESYSGRNGTAELVRHHRPEDEYLTVREAARRLPGRTPGKCYDQATVRRWMATGLYGVKLRSVVIGGLRQTKVRWLELFLRRVAALPQRATGAKKDEPETE